MSVLNADNYSIEQSLTGISNEIETQNQIDAINTQINVINTEI